MNENGRGQISWWTGRIYDRDLRRRVEWALLPTGLPLFGLLPIMLVTMFVAGSEEQGSNDPWFLLSIGSAWVFLLQVWLMGRVTRAALTAMDGRTTATGELLPSGPSGLANGAREGAGDSTFDPGRRESLRWLMSPRQKTRGLMRMGWIYRRDLRRCVEGALWATNLPLLASLGLLAVLLISSVVALRGGWQGPWVLIIPSLVLALLNQLFLMARIKAAMLSIIIDREATPLENRGPG